MFNTKLVMQAGVALALLVASGSEARSDTLPAIAGHAYAFADVSCFAQSGWAGIASSCAGTKSYVMALPNGFSAGNRTFKASSTGAPPGLDLSAPTCTAYVVSNLSGLVWQSATVGVQIGTTLGSRSAGTKDTFHIICGLDSIDRAVTSVQVL